MDVGEVHRSHVPRPETKGRTHDAGRRDSVGAAEPGRERCSRRARVRGVDRRRTAQRTGERCRAGVAARGRADRSHGLLGGGRQRGLAASNGDAAQRRLREPADQRRRPARRGRVGPERGQRGRAAMQSVRRRRHHAAAGPAAHHLGRRRHVAASSSTRARKRGSSSSERAAAPARRPGRDNRAPNGSGRRVRGGAPGARADRQQHGPDRAGRRRPRPARRSAADGGAERRAARSR